MSREEDYPELESTWATGADFMKHVSKATGTSTFFHPLSGALPKGAAAGMIFSLTLRFVDRDADFHVHARVLEADARGLRLSFLPEEKDRQELVLACAEGESIPYLRRRAVRTPCRLDVQVTFPNGTTRDATLTNISERGTHLVVDKLAADTRIELAIAFPDQRKRFKVVGRVTSPIDGPQRGAGIEFIFGSSKERDALAVEVARVRKR